MGGTKKPTISQAERFQRRMEKKEKLQKKEAKGPSLTQAERSVVMERLSEPELIAQLKPLKAITVYGASKALNLHPALANSILKSLESKGLLKRIGGYSGQYVYVVA